MEPRLAVEERQPDPPDLEGATLGLAGFFRKLSVYLVPHKGKVGLVLIACSLETGFDWIVPLAFRHLIDNTLASATRSGLIEVLVLLGAGSVIASMASLGRGRYWARVVEVLA